MNFKHIAIAVIATIATIWVIKQTPLNSYLGL